MEYTINYTICQPYSATVEADSPEEALKQVLKDPHKDWPFDEEEYVATSAEILDEDYERIEHIEDSPEHPYQIIEKLLGKLKNE